jgi:vancomycin resistance protein YoaR
MRAEAGVRPVRRGRPARERRGRARSVRHAKVLLWVAAPLLIALLAVGVVFAGSPERIPTGVTVAGVDVGGLTASEAQEKLATLAARYDSVPVEFTAGGERFAARPDRLGVHVDWAAAVASALDKGNGPLPLRGLQRVRVKLFGADVRPPAKAYRPALEHLVSRMASAVDTPARDASIELRGMRPMIVGAEAGARLPRPEAARVVLAALAGFERDQVQLPVDADVPAVTRETLLPVAAQVRTALSAPVRLTYRGGGWTIRPGDLAPLLKLPANGRRKLLVGGPAAERYFANLAQGVHRTAVSADFAVDTSGEVRVVKARPGRDLDVLATERGVLAAALREQPRTTRLVVSPAQPRLTTAEARALRIDRQLASYSTLYAGTADRIQNLQRAVMLLDGAVVSPGATFSFNRRVGPRTLERGFRSAPVIMNGEYEEGVGGGVSQVATTVFNAVWEAGLPITARTAHALYISRYPAGRDATVNYPDVDLQFRNDTGRSIVLQGSFDESGILIRLLGGGPTRRVESKSGPLEETAGPPVERTLDPTLYVGERVLVSDGEPRREIRVARIVYEGDEVLYRETWYTAYRAEPKQVRVGTKPKPVERQPASKEKTKGDGEPASGGSGSGSG